MVEIKNVGLLEGSYGRMGRSEFKVLTEWLLSEVKEPVNFPSHRAFTCSDLPEWTLERWDRRTLTDREVVLEVSKETVGTRLSLCFTGGRLRSVTAECMMAEWSTKAACLFDCDVNVVWQQECTPVGGNVSFTDVTEEEYWDGL